MYTKKYKAYVLVDPLTNLPRYVGITQRSLRARFSGHMSDIYNRPNLNKHKTYWFKKLLRGGHIPRIEQIAEFDTEEEMQKFEMDYIAKYKDEYKLINQTIGGEHLGFNAHSRESILKRAATRAVTQYNILGEKIADYEIIEDIRRTLNLEEKACSHITQCCKGKRRHAYGYIWRYKEDPLGDISDINPKSLYFNKLVQYDLEGNRINEFSSYKEASEAIGDNSKGGNIAATVNREQKTCKGYVFNVEPIYCYFSQELFDKIYKEWKPKVKESLNNRGKIVEQLDKDYHLIRAFNSLSDASLAMIGTTNARTSIKAACEKHTKYKDFYWRFKAS